MPATVRMMMVFLLAFFPIAFLQGCGSNSGGGSDTPSQGANLDFTLNSTSGVNTLTADGISSLDLEMAAIDQEAGRPVANLEITFTTNAGILSAANTANANARTDSGSTRQTSGNTVTVMTNANGIAQVTLTAGNGRKI